MGMLGEARGAFSKKDAPDLDKLNPSYTCGPRENIKQL